MPRGRPPKSIAVLKMEGQYRRDRHLGRGVAADGEPTKPPRLSKDASAVWDRIAPELIRLKVVGAVDSAMLGAYCNWSVLADRAMAAATADPDDATKQRMARLAGEVCYALADKFGLTPASRTRLIGSGAGVASKAEKFLR